MKNMNVKRGMMDLDADIITERLFYGMTSVKNATIIGAAKGTIAEFVNQLNAREGNAFIDGAKTFFETVGETLSISAHGIYDNIYKNGMDSLAIEDIKNKIDLYKRMIEGNLKEAKMYPEGSTEQKAAIERAKNLMRSTEQLLNERNLIETEREKYLNKDLTAGYKRIWNEAVENAETNKFLEMHIKEDAVASGLSSDTLFIQKTLAEQAYEAYEFVKNNLTKEQFDAFLEKTG
jgi:AraC-like DNA-binding protein